MHVKAAVSAVSVLAALTLTACGGSSQPSPAASSKSPAAHAAASHSTAPKVTQAAIPTASQLATRIGITGFTAYNAENDPNHLLGRQNEYISKVNWGSDLDNSIEVFPDASDMNERLTYLKAFQPPFGDGYDYPVQTAILRLSDDWTPTQAKQLETKFVLAFTGKS